MASSLASDRPSLPAPGDGASDPFVSNASGSTHHRFSNFDHELFAAGPGSSPQQAKRALEAHIAETERRLDEAGKLGTALVSQRKALAEQLQEVEKLQTEVELNPELRQKLVEIEKEYNDLAKESARAFLPKQRVPSNEANAGSPFVPEGRSGRRSVSPSKFESQATGSPTKLSVPNRKIRNQPSHRVHDIEFAAEISTSLIAQVRNLQSLLAERDDEVKGLQGDKSRLEIDSENFHQRFKTLDESEHRYKEENWNLETRLQEIATQQKDAADREKKIAQALNLSNSEKTSAQKELDEVKLSHAKLSEEHAAAVKHHDIELGTAKRNMVMAEGERSAMQRKIDDLTNQNQELAKAFSTQRGRTQEREPTSGISDDDFDTATDNITPEHSPPPSPVKGTPRHSMLETETMKTSLHHAQRTIQSQRSLLHREKTEKLELRRIIQDLRDDLEKTRNDAGAASSNRRSRKADSKEFKKPARLLGNFRSSRQEILADDPDWEDNRDASPRGSPSGTNLASRQDENATHSRETSDQFDTANEASESAFETANERATETEDFQTGNEDFSGSDGAETETEGAARGFGRMKQPPSLPAGLSRHGNRDSFHSTASTSADEDDFLPEAKTPTTQMSSQRSRFRISRDPASRNSRLASEESNMQSSPASFLSSNTGTPQAAGQSLFAELQDFGGSDDESVVDTPSRRNDRSATPASARRTVSPPPATPALSRVVMVDCGVMTDPVRIDVDETHLPASPASTLQVADAVRPISLGSVYTSANRDSTAWRSSLGDQADFSRPISTFSYSDAGAQYEHDIHEKLAQFPAPPTSPPQVNLPTPPSLSLSDIQSENIQPREELLAPQTPPALSLSTIVAEHMEPKAELETPRPTLTMTTISAEAVHPIASPDVVPPPLSLSSIAAEALEPIAEPEVVAASIPIVQPIPQPALSLSSIHAEHLEPKEELERVPVQPLLAYSGITTEHVVPVSEPQPSPPSLNFSSIAAEHTHPIIESPRAAPTLALSSIAAEGISPVKTPPQTVAVPAFGFSTIESIETLPMPPRSPRRDAMIIPRDLVSPFDETNMPETPKDKIFGSTMARGKNKDFSPVIAEDETRQSPRESPDSNTPESQRPFKEISTNSNVRPLRKQTVQTSDQGAQTALTAGTLDQLLKAGTVYVPGHHKSSSVSSVGSPDTTGTVKVYRQQDSPESPVRSKGKAMEPTVFDTSAARRPTSAASGKSSILGAPPLPSNHRQAIEAARSGSSSGQQGNMGPPLWPASAMKHRPRTPSQQRPMSATGNGTPTPRAVRTGLTPGHVDIQTPKRLTSRSRQSSVSSFASELDTRFNMRPGEMGMDPSGFGPNTDPRMIQAITQTMIGEYLWKYTRKTGRGEMSENRHRRYFWVHPYTRTLYWSDRDPSTAGRAELKAKSVPIEAVRVVTDDNPMPPGLHRKSLVIVSPGRTIKFTCTTGQRHETWFNALSYLLLRGNQDGQEDTEELAENITREDVDEFNPQFGRRPANGTRPQGPPSLSSYNSRTTRNESPAGGLSMEIPTLTPTAHRNSSSQRPTMGTLSKLSGYWKAGGPKLSGTFSSLRSRTTTGQNASIYEASEVHDSAEDLREMIERQDRESDRLENVRACCDGKHDVGTLHHFSRRGRGEHSHSHPGPSTTNTPMASSRSRA